MAGNLTVNNLACATVNDKSMATHVLENGLGGSGQTWQNVTASRALGTTYTNTTGKPIVISASTLNSGGGAGNRQVQLTINGNIVYDGGLYSTTGNTTITAQGIVPNNGTYSVVSAGAIPMTVATWMELR